jgi:dTDP-4-dehydrorhamnose reductase
MRPGSRDPAPFPPRKSVSPLKPIRKGEEPREVKPMEPGKHILVTGANGFVGSRLCRYLHENTDWRVRGIGRREGDWVDYVADISEARDLQDLGSRLPDSDTIIHTAAISRPSACDADPEECWRVNVKATRRLAEEFPDAKFIFFSTYAVYNREEGNSTEEAPVDPTNLYISTKLAGESAVLARRDFVILRPSVIFGLSDAAHDNYFMTLYKTVRAGREMVSQTNQFFNPVHVDVVCRIVRDIISLGLVGVYNVGSNEGMSKYEFNRAVLDRFGLGRVPVTGRSESTDGIARPLNATISSEKIQKGIGYRIPSFPEMLDILFRECRELDWSTDARSSR